MPSMLEVPSFSVTEVDDYMEVSSDHGNYGADEDIDIDIDIPSGHTEEDVVLDDATFNNGFGEKFQHQPSPANDELMVDEIEEQFEFHPEDVLIDETGADGMDHETHAMSFEEPANIEFTETQLINITNQESGGKDDVTFQATNILAATEEPHIGPLGGNIVASTANPYLPKVIADRKEIGVLIDHEDEVSTVEPQRKSHSPTPPVRTIGTIDPPNSLSAISPTAPKETLVHTTNIDSHAIEANGTSPGVTPTHELNNSVSNCQVVVTYQDSEYALFSTSDSDHVDSFFLSDCSTIYKPLRELFQAIRVVIHDELSEDDELYIFVEDLKLEVTENYLSNQDLTFNKIMDLHSKLLRNDGVENPRSLHLYLGTRPNFAIRFDALTRGAAEGKGLSDVIQWDQSSDGPDGVWEAEEYAGENAQAVQTKEDEVVGDILDTPLEHNRAETPTDIHRRETSNLSDAVSNTPATQSIGLEDEDSSARQVDEALVHSTELGTDGGEFEEDDLIDYSDEELDNPTGDGNDLASELQNIDPDDSRTHNGISADSYSRCLKPWTCFCSDCNDLLIAEYEAKNEELQRRSLSRAAEEPLSESPISQSGGKQEDDVDNESENEVEDPSGDVQGAGENLSGPNEEAPQAELDDESAHNFVTSLVDEGYDIGHREWEGEETILDPQDGSQLDEQGTNVENGKEIFEDEIDFVDDGLAQSDDYPGLSTANVAAEFDHLSRNTRDPLNGPIETNLGTFNIEDAESIRSDKTLEAQPESEIENEDEINYDDDDEDIETSFKVQPVVSAVEVAPVPGELSSKRVRSEELLDEGIDARGKEAKRPRS